MTKLELINVSKTFGEVRAADTVSFLVNEGEWLTLLGPSGCGKTTTLRLIAGFLKLDEGEILVDGEIISSAEKTLPPEKRDMGMVFQAYAVWPHMTVFDNVAFGLRLMKRPRRETEQRVNKVLDLVKLSGLEYRYPSELSGGQQQRVAVARSLVTESKIILFDEPLSNLDAKLREELRFELRELQARLGFTALYVTHDQDEALVMSDRICVMNEGRIEQIGSPWAVYHYPHTKFVAGFIGLTNFLEGRFVEKSEDKGKVHCERIGAALTGLLGDEQINQDASVTLSIRPEAIKIIQSSQPEQGMDNIVEARIMKSIFLGNMIEYRLDLQGVELRVQELTRTTEHLTIPKEGSVVKAWLDPDLCKIIA